MSDSHLSELAQLPSGNQIDWQHASVDAASVARAPGSPETGSNPTDRGKLGSKRYLIVDGCGTPLAVCVSGANLHDSMLFEDVIDAVPPGAGRRGRPRRRPDKAHADKGYDYPKCRRVLSQRGIAVRIARRGIESSARLGRYREVVERTHVWFAGFGKLRIRFERRLDTHMALLRLACAVICLRAADGFC